MLSGKPGTAASSSSQVNPGSTYRMGNCFGKRCQQRQEVLSMQWGDKKSLFLSHRDGWWSDRQSGKQFCVCYKTLEGVEEDQWSEDAAGKCALWSGDQDGFCLSDSSLRRDLITAGGWFHLEENWQRELERLFSLASEGATWWNNMQPGKPSLAVRSVLLGNLTFSLCCSKKECLSAWYAFIQLLGILLSEVSMYNRARLHGVGVTLPSEINSCSSSSWMLWSRSVAMSSVWLSLMGFCLQNVTVIQACGSCRSRCILRWYFLLIYHLPLKAQNASSSQYDSRRHRPEDWSAPENTHLSGWYLADWPCPCSSRALRGCTQVSFSREKQ